MFLAIYIVSDDIQAIKAIKRFPEKYVNLCRDCAKGYKSHMCGGCIYVCLQHTRMSICIFLCTALCLYVHVCIIHYMLRARAVLNALYIFSHKSLTTNLEGKYFLKNKTGLKEHSLPKVTMSK